MDERVSVKLPSLMFKEGYGNIDDFIAFVIKSPRCGLSPETILRIDPLNKKIDSILITSEILKECSILDFVAIDGTPYNVFHLGGDEEWNVLIEGFKNAESMIFKGCCYITGNIYKDENGWGVLPVKFSLKEAEEWIKFK